jgi:hypothetical protein
MKPFNNTVSAVSGFDPDRVTADIDTFHVGIGKE